MRVCGLTLVELLVTLLIASLLLGLGVPSTWRFVQQQRSTAALQQVLGGLAFARNSALTRNTTVTLCPAQGPRCGSRDTWHNGSLVFQDRNANGLVDPNDDVLRHLSGWQHGGRLSWRAFRSRPYLQFTHRGFTNWQNGSFVYCPPTNDLRLARRVVLNAAGRAYRAYDRNGDGIDEGSRGRPLPCS